ncbi:putative secreted protein (Por secretion system target) [Dysgonomonas alginatilytica]|uniref:Putative secreted protein (Por secretion system target) n=1 Tax=Dysgonomonas alginatilytica TaxID=1605892 RepID=A0A2V3PTS1_9BACT|nr:T9SS type A sorting domain-containing protein [Dysgonomonas alginatilytica]PXV69013.1 putative secreted protein (Por secretion system target) [Dysgonomonas alginatilytica]
MSIYPNPVTDILYVNSQQAILSFDIYNIAGSLMKKADYSGNNAINVQSLPSGIYVLILKSAEGQLSFKFSKK